MCIRDSQYTRRANETGNIYAADIDDIRTRLDSLWDGMDKLCLLYTSTDGFTCFMSGFADGVDQYFAELVLERKQTNPALELIAVIPYRKRLDSLNKKTRTRELLEACADVVVIQAKYIPSVYSHRNRYMVEHSDRVIAVYDGRETGGTAKTIRFTHRMKKELREIPVGEIVLPDHLKPKTK